MKVGAFVGKFYPPHIGHLWVIDNLAPKLDKLYVIISKNDTRNKEISKNFETLDAELIKKWFSQHYSNNKKIVVEIFDESNFKPFPEDLDKWSEKFKKQFPDVNIKIADESYRAFNQKYFSEYDTPENVLALRGGSYLVCAHIVYVQVLFQTGNIYPYGVFAVLHVAAVYGLVDVMVAYTRAYL